MARRLAPKRLLRTPCMLLKEHLVRTFSSLTNATHQRNQAPMTLVVKEGDTLKRKKNCGSDKPLLLLLLHNMLAQNIRQKQANNSMANIEIPGAGSGKNPFFSFILVGQGGKRRTYYRHIHNSCTQS
eukprot:1145941-Pelagomonas_calceolata.AAC.1